MMKSKNPKIQIFKNGIAILLVFMFLLSPIAYATTSLDDGYLEGSLLDKLIYGTVGSTAKEIEEYLERETTLYITNEIQLRALAEYVNNGGNTVGKQIKLLNDIQVNRDQEWIPIGTESTPFKGVFDGMGYTIKGIVFNKENKSYVKMTNVGLFGYVKKDTNSLTEIKNVVLSDTVFSMGYEETDAFVMATSEKQTYANLGGIVGYNDEATIENCRTTKDVMIKGAREVGGIVGYNHQGKIKGCFNQAMVVGLQSVGGIAGANVGDDSVSSRSTSLNFAGEKVAKIMNSTNEGNIQILLSDVGGIAGLQSHSAIIQKCINLGNVSILQSSLKIFSDRYHIPQNAGGIVGWSSGEASEDEKTQYYTIIDGCINRGSVNGSGDIGGIVGQLAGEPHNKFGNMTGGYAILSNCINYSTNVRATKKDSEFGEVGFLAGEVGVNETGMGIMYNNLYVLDTTEEVIKEYDNNGNESSTTLTLGYGVLSQGEDNETGDEYFYDKFSSIGGNTTNIVIRKNNEYAIVGPEAIKDAVKTEDNTYKTTSMRNYNLTKEEPEEGYTGNDITTSPVMFMYYPIATETSSNQTILIKDKKVNVDKSSILYEYDEKLKGFNLVDTDKTEDVIDSKTNTKVEYTITKNGDKTPIRENAYFKEGDTITITAKFNKYLTSGWGSAEPLIEAPTLTLVGEDNKKIELTNGNVTGKKYSSTEITYQYVVQEGDNVDITKLKLSKVGTIYVLSSASEHTSFSGISKETNIFNLHIDTVAPLIDTKVYVENALETGRYTAGKEILIEVKTNEPIQDKYENMEIQVNFSESGVGKYNYTKEPETVGYAKCKDAKINIDGTTTWAYSYQIQEGDEGNISLTYIKGQIKDLAGNQTNIPEKINLPSATHGDNKNITNIIINKDRNFVLDYELYKNGTKLTNFDEITKLETNDTLEVKAIFNKGMYTAYGNTASGTSNIKKVDKETAPTLKLNNSIQMECSTVNVTDNKKTVIEYTYKVKKDVEIQKINTLDMMRPAYYCTDSEQTIQNTNDSNKNNVLVNSGKTNQNITDLNLVIDTIGAEVNVESIYADTTAPTVEIIAKDIENNITNKDVITYEFKWSEELAKEEGRTFEASDITVNNGTKGELVQDKNNPKVYTMVVTPTVASGNEGELQVVVEKGACQDLVGHENVRTEKIITVDKKAPKLENYTITKSEDGTKIIIEAIYNEAISDAKGSNLKLTIGDREAAGTQEEAEVLEPNNKVKYVYNISGADGGKVEATIVGKVKDIAGNHSEELNANIENNITLQKEVIKTDDAEYSFRKNSTDITDFANPTYFKENDTIRVTKTVEETTEEGKTLITKKVYSYQIVPPYADNTHMKYMTLTEPEEGKTIGKATFGTSKVTGSIDITDANIYFDTTMPEIKTQVVAKNPKDGLYKAEEELIITAITSEKIKEDFVPEINVKFGEKAGKFNNGKAQYIETKQNEDSTTTWTYRYVVSEGDEGKVALSYTRQTITDLAGNKTGLDTLNTKEGIFELNNITVDATAPTVQITAKKLDATKVTDINGNITNADIIRYTFTWSEQVEGFTADDITVNNGTKGTLAGPTKNADGTYTYTMDITTNVANGSVGDIQVIVEKGACKDLVGHENVRTESVIRVDKQAPILISLEAYGTSNIKVSPDVDSVKQYYKAGDTVTIVATFTENIGEKTTTVPTLALQFSESGNAKGQVSTGETEGNKITYTYTITEDDMGLLSVKGFTGQVIDAAGNKTIVTKRNLDGDTIIADTVAPKLVGITAIAPDFEYDELVENPGDTKRYGVESKTREHNTITIIAEYSENVYKLDGTVIKKLENKIGNGNVPNLGLKFGNVNATGTIKVKEVKENKIIYEYDIHENDNGDFSIVSIGGKVSDIAGNESNINQLPEKDKIVYYEKEVKEENKVDKITADTRKPLFTISTLPQMATDKDDNGNTITGNNLSNQYYYRKGSIITITATADEYIYKNNSNDLTKFTKDNMPAISLKFGDLAAKGRFTEKDVKYEAGKTIFTYKYEIAEGDNGKLSTSIAGDIGYDIALNGNNSNINAVSTSINADTVNPVTNWQSWVESEQYGIVDNQNGTWTVTFSEKLYTYNPDTHTVGSELSNSNKSSAPILLVSKDNVTPLETRVSSITTTNGKTVITYTYSPYTKNIGAYGMKFANVSDKAGNLFNYKDQQAPILSNIKVINPATGTYKAGQEITIVAIFSEKITGTAPTLKLKFGETLAKGTVSGGIIGEDGKTITYKYTITAGDNGLLSLESYTGTGLKDLSDNPWVAPENVTLSGNTITADTIAPTVVITSNVEKTNQDKVTYTFTWSEDVVGFTADDIEVINGLKGTFTKVNNKVYTLEVDTTNEGRQIVKVNANVCQDIAGNPNTGRVTYNKVVIDYTKPEIRAKVNGGDYVIDTDSKKSTLKETIVVNEEVSKFEYIWTKDNTIPTTGFTEVNPDTIQVNSDIHLETQVTETGTYYLYVKVTDKAGNVFEGRTNAFVVSNAQITLTPNATEKTNQDVTVTINYGNGLTENRKAGVQGKTQSADATKVIAVENGTVYAEATDKAGNKVYATLEITNIDKTKPTEPDTPPVEEDKIAPEITFNYTTTTATVGTAIGATITTNEDAMIEYSWDNQNWTSSQDFIRSINARRTPTSAGTYTLYAKATDKASNTSNVSTLQFTVVKSDDDIVKPEIIFEDLTTIQKDGVKYVKVSPNYTTEMLTAKMDKDALLGKTPAYEKLTSDKKLRTGSEITIDGSTKYIIIVNGDVNCDGKVDFLGDIVMINNYRIGVNHNLSEIQILAGDINNSGSIEFIPDIVAMNNYRLGRINVL